MPQSGFTPIITYNTATASAAPSAGNLTQGELAVNVTDKKIYTKNSGGSVVQVGSGPDATETLTNKTLTSPDINGGTIDGTVIGSTTPAAGNFTTLSASGANEAVTSYGVSPLYLYCTTAFGIDVGPSLGFYGKADGGAATQFGNISARKENATSGNTAGYLSFATRVHGSTPTEKMRISSTGAVTIPETLAVGSANTSYRLSASGTTGDHKLFLRRSNNNANGFALWTDASGVLNAEYRSDSDVAISGPLFSVAYSGAVTIPGSVSSAAATFANLVVSGTSTNSISKTITNADVGSSSWVEYVAGSAGPSANGSWGLYNGGVRMSITTAGAVTIPGGITQESVIAPTLLNSWVNYGGVFATAGYWKDTLGNVHLQGSIKSGTTSASTNLFTLPAGYRPSAVVVFPVLANTSMGGIYVDTSGNVVVQVAISASITSLDGISFKV